MNDKKMSAMARLNPEDDFFNDPATYDQDVFLNRSKIARYQTDFRLSEAYEKHSIISACVDAIAAVFSATEFSMYRITNAKGDTEELSSHPVVDLLYNPNSYQSKTQFLRFYAIQMLVFGRAFILRKFNVDSKGNAGSQVMGLEILPSLHMEVLVNDGVMTFRYTDVSKTSPDVKEYNADEVIFICNAGSVSPFIGQSPTKSCAAETYLLDKALDYQVGSFDKVSPHSYIKVASNEYVDMGDEKVINAYREAPKRISSTEESGRMPVVQDADIISTRMTPAELDFSTTMKDLNMRILHAFRLPISFLGQVEDVNRNSMEELQKIVSETLIEPMQMTFTQVLQRDLVIRNFNTTELLRHESNYKQSLRDRMEIATLGHTQNDIHRGRGTRNCRVRQKRRRRKRSEHRINEKAGTQIQHHGGHSSRIRTKGTKNRTAICRKKDYTVK